MVAKLLTKRTKSKPKCTCFAPSNLDLKVD